MGGVRKRKRGDGSETVTSQQVQRIIRSHWRDRLERFFVVGCRAVQSSVEVLEPLGLKPSDKVVFFGAPDSNLDVFAALYRADVLTVESTEPIARSHQESDVETLLSRVFADVPKGRVEVVTGDPVNLPDASKFKSMSREDARDYVSSFAPGRVSAVVILERSRWSDQQKLNVASEALNLLKNGGHVIAKSMPYEFSIGAYDYLPEAASRLGCRLEPVAENVEIPAVEETTASVWKVRKTSRGK